MCGCCCCCLLLYYSIVESLIHRSFDFGMKFDGLNHQFSANLRSLFGSNMQHHTHIPLQSIVAVVECRFVISFQMNTTVKEVIFRQQLHVFYL